MLTNITIETYADATDATITRSGTTYRFGDLAVLRPADKPGWWYLKEIGRGSAIRVESADELHAGLAKIRARRVARWQIWEARERLSTLRVVG